MSAELYRVSVAAHIIMILVYTKQFNLCPYFLVLSKMIQKPFFNPVFQSQSFCGHSVDLVISQCGQDVIK